MRVTKALLCLIFLQSGPATSTQNPDSLRALLADSRSRDTAHVNLLNAVSEAGLSYTTMDSGFYWSGEALALARTLEFKSGEAKALYLQGRVYAFKNVYPLAADALLRAQTIYRTLRDINGVAECFLQTGVLMYSQKNFNEALKNFEEANILF